jgi:hypothetical protein
MGADESRRPDEGKEKRSLAPRLRLCTAAVNLSWGMQRRRVSTGVRGGTRIFVEEIVQSPFRPASSR